MLIIKSTFVKIRLLHISTPKKILISALDWGMGHTTRSVPIIQNIINAGYEAIFAGNEWQCAYIKQTFPSINTVSLKGYNVRYSTRRNGFMLALLKQLPGLFKTIKAEHNWLEEILDEKKIDGVISDNRYGLWTTRKPCVILTHQLSPISGLGKIIDSIVRRLHYRQLEKFTDCWIVDVADANNLSGKLGHPNVIPENGRYIGLLSQLNNVLDEAVMDNLLVLLSGPEPQRTILSDILWHQLKDYNGNVCFVEGVDMPGRSVIPANIQYFKRIERQQLQPLLQSAQFVICRSGYSTLMDLVRLNKKAALIPTPGQTEQIYLGSHLREKGIFLAYDQRSFNINTALTEAQSFPFKQPYLPSHFTAFKPVLLQWLNRL